MAPDRDPEIRPDDRRLRLARAAGRVNGLETLVLGWHGKGTSEGSGAFPAVVIIAWRDPESMIAATGRDELGFLRERLGLHLNVARAETFEVMSRTFASLPTERSVMRILTITARPDTEGQLFERLREVQRDLSDRGLIASHVARRVAPGRIEALVVGVFRDHDAIDRATGGEPSRPAYVDRLREFIEHVDIDTYEAMEIAPRLPLSAGPPILVFDDFGRIVDLTPSAAAVLGRTQDEAIGMLMADLRSAAPTRDDKTWDLVLGGGADLDAASGEADWIVPSGGHVRVRWFLRRDVPVIGRHAALARRRQDPPPTSADLDAALAEAFPRDPSLIGA